MKIVVFDDVKELVDEMVRLAKISGCEAYGVVVGPRDAVTGFKSVIQKIQEYDPDVIVADQSLCDDDIGGIRILESLGDKFWCPSAKNPRVVSSSKKKILSDIAGAVYQVKEDLIVPDNERCTMSQHLFVQMLSELSQKAGYKQ